MEFVRALFASGHVVDLVLAVLAAEFVWLVLRGNRALDVGLGLSAAVLMMLALRAALTGAAWQWIALPLVLSFPLHLADLVRRGMLVKRGG
ncbi:hypothetical protein [Blastomonas sp. CCH5-A3]|jgi:hypothetical protein|uniref:hypothetical protein n=1 Tax=Blastomonas sp. CCH5-A3 TaxID=1768761 RepID=UPI000A7B5D64|nr:hypothetical protein [Blastomonas sp. CCH5-A3]MAF62356.1 hypothetical protein [Blastomonas sp.]|tara:strand:+ start:46273 stop:46545 length:273 start_codon:yes stop_codon:yes gene_type:complete